MPAPSVFDTVRADVAAKLTAALAVYDLEPATLDPATLPPFVLVDLLSVTRAEGIGGWGCDLPIRIVVPPPGDVVAAAALGDRLEVVLRTLGYCPAVPDEYRVGDRTPAPSYTVTYPVSVPNPDC